MSTQQSIQNIPHALYRPAIQNTQHPALTYNQPSIQNMQVDEIEYRKPLGIENNQSLAIENQQQLALEARMYVCTLCTTYTKFNDHKKLERHLVSFHKDFQGKRDHENKNDEKNYMGIRIKLKKQFYLNMMKQSQYRISYIIEKI